MFVVNAEGASYNKKTHPTDHKLGGLVILAMTDCVKV